MENMPYLVKALPLEGSTEIRVRKQALSFYQEIKSRTKRKPYVRSSYFRKQKVFLDLFWSHSFEKSRKVRAERFKLLPCAIELLENITTAPQVLSKPKETWYRFVGRTSKGAMFVVQVKQRLGRLYFISVYGK